VDLQQYETAAPAQAAEDVVFVVEGFADIEPVESVFSIQVRGG
jgi:hypothetical protein